ncbi:MAG: hypothetical protein SGJ01_12475 [Gemmatimonadota bacterium]|nr:hypothetical protein [Gemmatimonadota bacterium]MDZ4864248.1 hypothetical protein [Gemmatimonadota bacterium]
MLGTRRVQLVRTGRGNTAGDAIAFIPDAGVLLTGDLVTVPCPFPSAACFSEWIVALDRLKEMRATRIVPGHGHSMTDYGYNDLVRELLLSTREQARATVRAGTPVDTLQQTIDFGSFIQRFGGGDIVRTDAINSFYREPAARRAFDEAQFESQGAILQ